MYRSGLLCALLAVAFSSRSLFALPTPEVIGEIEQIELENGSYYVTGWTCQVGRPESLKIHFYADASAYDIPRGTLVYHSAATLRASLDTDQKCQAQGLYQFRVLMPFSVLKAAGGKKMYVHGIKAISTDPKLKHSALKNSGIFTFPFPVSYQKPGCMRSRWADSSSRNAYSSDFLEAPGSKDDWKYMAWVWREGAGVETNHSVSVARSKDLITWENTCGERLPSPITAASRAVVDPVLPSGGLLNNVKIGFDSEKRPVVSYMKYKKLYSQTEPPKVTTQVYNARLEAGEWKFYQMTNWTGVYWLDGKGALPYTDESVNFGAVNINASGQTTQTFTRSVNDTTGTPATGTAVLDILPGALKLSSSSPITALDYYAYPPGFSSIPNQDPKFTNSFGIQFSSNTRFARIQDRWISLLGDWLGDGTTRTGNYDRRTGSFNLEDASGGIKQFKVEQGTNNMFLWPMVVGVKGTSTVHVGLFDPFAISFHIRQSLTSGPAEVTVPSLSANGYALLDSPLKFSRSNPKNLYALRYGSIAPNRDLPYDCNGNALTLDDPTKDGAIQCPERFITDLQFWRFDNFSKQWTYEVIDKAWPTRAGFDLLYFNQYAIVAYYDSSRSVKLAIRDLNQPDGPWTKRTLSSSKVFSGWDQHNTLSIEVDDNRDIHVSGNLHVNPLNYWRGSGLTVTNIETKPMVDPSAEINATYPQFMRGPSGQLLFKYRRGHSYSGTWYLNQYDLKTKSWRRLTTLFDQ